MKIGRWEAQCVGGYKRLADVDELYAQVDSEAVCAAVKRYFSADTWNVVRSLPAEEAAQHE